MPNSIILLIGFFVFIVFLPLIYRLYITQWSSDFIEKDDYLPLIYTSPISNLDSFGFGIIAAFIYSVKLKMQKNINWMGLPLLIISSLLIIFLLDFTYEKGWRINDGIFSPSFYYLLLNAGWSLMILSVMMLKNSQLDSLTATKGIRFISMISYGMYIWHGLVYGYITRLFRYYEITGAAFTISFLILGPAVVIGVSILSWYIIELPFLRLREQKLKAFLS